MENGKNEPLKKDKDWLFFPFNILIPNSLLQIIFFLLQTFNLLDLLGFGLSQESTSTNVRTMFGNALLLTFHNWQPIPFYLLIGAYIYSVIKYLKNKL